jgi:hypothetical protein
MSKKGVASLIIVGALLIAGVIVALTMIKQAPPATPNSLSTENESDPLLEIFNNVSPNELKSDFLSDAGPQKYTGPVPTEVVSCVNSIENANNLATAASEIARTLINATAACKAANAAADCECEDLATYDCYGLNTATPPVYVENPVDPDYQCANYTHSIVNPDGSVNTIGTLKSLKKQACIANEKTQLAITGIPIPEYRYGVKHTPGTVLAAWNSVAALAYSQNPANTREAIKADLTPVFGYAVSRNQINWSWDGKTKQYTFKTAPGDEVLWACYFTEGSNFFKSIFRAKLVSLQLADVAGLKGEFIEFTDPVEKVVSGPTAKVSWDKVPNATHYIVYTGTNSGGLEPMKDPATGNPKLIAENTVTLKALPRDATYFVIVQAVQDGNGKYGTQTEESEAEPTYTASSDFIQTLNIYYTDDVKTRFIKVSKRSDECGNKEVFSTEECDDGKHCSNGTACTSDSQCATVSTGDQLCTTRSSDGCTKNCKTEKKLCESMKNPNPTISDPIDSTKFATCLQNFDYEICRSAFTDDAADADKGVTYGNTCSLVLNPAAGVQKEICCSTVRADKQANYAELIQNKICDNTCFEGDCRPRAATFDKDSDGVLSNVDADIDGDTIPNATDNDMDGDGVPNTLDPYPTL